MRRASAPKSMTSGHVEVIGVASVAVGILGTALLLGAVAGIDAPVAVILSLAAAGAVTTIVLLLRGRRSVAGPPTTGVPRILGRPHAVQVLDELLAASRSPGVVVTRVEGLWLVDEVLGRETGGEVRDALAERAHDRSDPFGWVDDELLAVVIGDPGPDHPLEATGEGLSRVLRRPVPVGASVGMEFRVHVGTAATSMPDTAAALLSRAEAAAGVRPTDSTRGGVRPRRSAAPAAPTKRSRSAAGREHDLREAIDGGRLFLEYQPVIAPTTYDVIGAEALARWRHRREGRIPPSEFIPLAERLGLGEELGRQLLNQACEEARSWQDLAPDRMVVVSVNVSPSYLRSTAFLDDVRDALRCSGLDPQRLLFEVSNAAVLEHIVEGTETLGALRAMGVGIAIDDFDTSSAAVGYLGALPVNQVKMARERPERVGSGGPPLATARAAVQLASELDLVVVGKGAEDEGEVAVLRELGCHAVQGFALSQPVAASAFRRLAGIDVSAGRPARTDDASQPEPPAVRWSDNGDVLIDLAGSGATGDHPPTPARPEHEAVTDDRPARLEEVDLKEYLESVVRDIGPESMLVDVECDEAVRASLNADVVPAMIRRLVLRGFEAGMSSMVLRGTRHRSGIRIEVASQAAGSDAETLWPKIVVGATRRD